MIKKQLISKRGKLEALCNKKRDLQKKLKSVHCKIDEIQRDISLPLLKQKYEGRYFRYQNSLGDKKWWIYVYVKSVSLYDFTINSFEYDPCNNQSIVQVDRKINSTYLFQHKITKELYNVALKKFKATHLEVL